MTFDVRLFPVNVYCFMLEDPTQMFPKDNDDGLTLKVGVGIV